MAFGKKDNKKEFDTPRSLDDLSDKDIIALLADKETTIADRNALITQVEHVVFNGEFTNELDKMLGTEVRQSKRGKLMINMCLARMIDKANQTRGMPDLKVKVSSPDQLERYVQTRITTNAIYDLWEFSNLPQLLPQIGMRLSYAGYCPVVTLPDFAAKKVKLTLRDPKSIMADFAGSSSLEFNWVGFSYKMTGRQIINTWPKAASIVQINYSNDEYEVKEFLTGTKRIFFVLAGNGQDSFAGRIPGTGVEHNLGFIPVQVIQNIPTPNRLESIPDIAHLLGLNENINEITLLHTKEIRERQNPLLVLKGADSLPQDLPDGEGKFVEAGPEGEIGYVPKVAGDPAEVFQHVSHQMQTFREQASWPLSTSGTINSSIWTGKGINASQQGSRELAQGVKENIGSALIRLDEMALSINKKMFPKVKQEVYDFYGGPEGEKEMEYLYFEDLPDINQYRHELVFYPQGYDASVEQVNLMQLKGQGILSARTVRDKLAGINADEEHKRIKQERQEEMEEQVAMMNAQAQVEQQAAPPQEQQQPMPVEKALPDMPPEMMEALGE